MKRLASIIIALTLVSGSLQAQEVEGNAAGEGKDKKITIIDGKRFFPLREARHFAGEQKPMPLAPKRQFSAPALIHHDIRGGQVKPPETAQHALPAEKNVYPVSASPGHGNENSGNSKVLDVFVPQERGQ